MKGFQVFVASMFLIALITIGLFNVSLVSSQRVVNDFTIINIVSRQKQLVQRYAKEVLLYINRDKININFLSTSTYDLNYTKSILLESNTALIEGKEVTKIFEKTEKVNLSPAPTEEIKIALINHKNTLENLFEKGEALLFLEPNHPQYKNKISEFLSAEVEAYKSADTIGSLYDEYFTNNSKRLLTLQLIITILFLLVGFFFIIFLVTSRNRLQSELKQITKEIKKQEDRFRIVVEAAPNAIIMVGKEGKITLVNKQAESLFEYPREELIGMTIENLIPKRFREKHPEHRKGFFANPTPRAMGAGRDLYGLTKNGKEVPIEIGLNPIVTESGQFVLASIVNITERKRIEEALKTTIEKLAISNSELESFTVIASHDLQEPLRKITAFGDRLEELCANSIGEKGIDYLQRMKSAAKRMRQLIDDLLLLSRVTTKANPYEKVDLNEVVKEVIADLESRIEESNGDINIKILPTINADRVQMHQLFQNLISNALKYKKEYSQAVVNIDSKHLENNSVEITVSDNGIGFEEQYSDLIFKPFQRLHTRTEYEGSGIGLAICKKIVNRHKGTITAKSALNKGTDFTIILPLN